MKKVIIFLLFLLFFIAGIIYFWFNGITKKIFISHENNAITQVNSIQKHFDDQSAINFVLLGYGGGNHDGAYLTDSIMAVRIDPKIKKIFLISIPRDIWVKIPDDNTGGNYYKVNAAYEIGLGDASYPNKPSQFKGADGGGHLAEYMISQVTGLPIDYFVGMDFSGFKNTINTLGGVDVNVETAFTDPEYPIDGKEDDPCGHTPEEIQAFTASTSAETDLQNYFSCRYEILHFDKGIQHMDGQTALSYVRSRHSLEDGTDFGRAKRQRNLLVSVKQKVFSIGFVTKVLPFMTSLGDDFRTDLSLDDVKTFLQHASELNKYQIETLALTDQNYLIDTVSSDGQAILEPKDGIDNFTSIHQYISDTITGKAPPLDAIVEVDNGTVTTGLAQKVTDTLSNAHIQTIAPTTATTLTDKSVIKIVNENVNPDQINTIKKLLGIQTVVTEKTEDNNSYNVVVVLGKDYIPQ